MSLAENFSNSVSGGALTTLGAAIATTGTTSITTSGAAPSGLQTAGTQFRILIDTELMIVTAGAATTTWTVTRGAEGTTAATHLNGANIYQPLTAAALGGQSDPTLTTPGLRSRSSFDPVYAAQWPNLVCGESPLAQTALGNPGSNWLPGTRVIVPFTGTLHDIAVFVGTASGNAMVAVYDTGQATANTRTKLYGSASTAVAGSNAWQVVADPALAVTAGQQIDLAIMVDNATATFAKTSGVSTAAHLPTNFWPSNCAPYLTWAFSVGSFALPATVTDAQAAASSNVPYIMARVA